MPGIGTLAMAARRPMEKVSRESGPNKRCAGSNVSPSSRACGAYSTANAANAAKSKKLWLVPSERKRVQATQAAREAPKVRSNTKGRCHNTDRKTTCPTAVKDAAMAIP
jgi:hypothetical protein